MPIPRPNPQVSPYNIAPLLTVMRDVKLARNNRLLDAILNEFDRVRAAVTAYKLHNGQSTTRAYLTDQGVPQTFEVDLCWAGPNKDEFIAGALPAARDAGVGPLVGAPAARATQLAEAAESVAAAAGLGGLRHDSEVYDSAGSGSPAGSAAAAGGREVS